jgi:hypothetical protein
VGLCDAAVWFHGKIFTQAANEVCKLLLQQARQQQQQQKQQQGGVPISTGPNLLCLNLRQRTAISVDVHSIFHT